MIKAIIFDLDGTLCDTMDDLLTAMNGMLADLGYPLRTRSDLFRFINRGARRFVGRSLPDGLVEDFDDPHVTEAMRVYSEHYSHCYAAKTHEYAGMTEALTALRDAGYALGVLSNKQDRFVKDIIAKIFPDGLFSSVNGQTELPEKPDPAAAYAVAEALGAKPCECVFVGDSDIDMKTGVNAGMFPLGVTWGYRDTDTLMNAGAGMLVASPALLSEVIGEISKGTMCK